MTIQFILAFIILILAAYAIRQIKTSAPIAICMLLCCMSGLLLVIFPAISTDIANFLGVGRGADLVIYILAVLTLGGIFNLHLRIRATQELITNLARAQAIASARKPL
ncbi:MAG: DUF2304 family protein [Rhizobium rhizophilum]|uniref:DUF2304 family protein n=1 Tax=Rhizobium rhizophilum TaxID=1850373 RepID=UPI00391A84FB